MLRRSILHAFVVSLGFPALAAAAVTTIPIASFTSDARLITFETVPLLTGVRFEFNLGRDAVLFEGVPFSEPSSRPVTISDSSVTKPRAGEPGASAPALQNAAGTNLKLHFVSPMNRVGFQFRRTTATGDDDLAVTLRRNGVVVGSYTNTTVTDSYVFIGLESSDSFDEVEIDAFGTGNGRFNIDNLRFEGPTDCRISNAAHASAAFAMIDPGDPNTLGSVPIGAETFQWLGSRFTVAQTTQVSAVGGHINGNNDFGDGRIFAAIVRLAGPNALPPSIPGDPNNPFDPGKPIDPSEIVASTTFRPPDFGPFGGDDIRVPLSATLTPGTYAVVFGSGDLDGNGTADTTGDAGFPVTGTPVGSVHLLLWGLNFFPLDPNDPNSPGTLEYSWLDIGDGGFGTGWAPRLVVDAVTKLVEVAGGTTSFTLDASASRDPDVAPGVDGSGKPNGLSFLWTSTCAGVSFDDAHSPTPLVTVDTSAHPCSHSCEATVTITDAHGQSCDVTTFILIADTTAPSLDIPADFAGLCGTSIDPSVTGMAVSDGSLSYVDAPAPAGPCQTAIDRTWTAMDACGNSTSGVQRITLTDATPPTLADFPADAVVECGSSTAPSLLGEPTAQDDCGAASLGYVDLLTVGLCTGSATLTRTWTATDNCGQFTSRDQVITIVDTTPPTFVDFPPDTTISCGASTDPADTGGSPGGVDSCDPSPVVSYVDTASSGSTCGAGYVIHRAWTVRDACLNEYTQEQTITVVSASPPTFTTFPADVAIDCEDDSSPDGVGMPTAADGCGGVVTPTYVDELDPAPTTCPVVAVIIRTWTATDGCDNFAQQTQRITLEDHAPPTIVCPPPVVVTAPAGQCFVSGLSLGTPTAGDSCGPVTLTDTRPATFPVGETLVTWRATDQCGHYVECQQSVTVLDAQPPAITATVATTLLWPPNHSLVNVGLAVNVLDACDTGIAPVIKVYSNEDDQWWADGFRSPDAKNLASGTLRLRAERSMPGVGRVYLIVAQATDHSGNVAETTSTVVVPANNSRAALALVTLLADVSRIWYDAFGCPPPGFVPVGDGPVIGTPQ